MIIGFRFVVGVGGGRILVRGIVHSGYCCLGQVLAMIHGVGGVVCCIGSLGEW